MAKVTLAVDQMDTRALWDAAFARIDICRWETQYTVQERDAALADLKRILLELQLRGQQLKFALDPGSPPRMKQPRDAA